MGHNSSVLFKLEFHILSTKGSYQSTNFVKLPVRTLMAVKSNAKFEEKLICGFKYDIKNLVNFHVTTQKSKNFTSMGSFCSKYIFI